MGHNDRGIKCRRDLPLKYLSSCIFTRHTMAPLAFSETNSQAQKKLSKVEAVVKGIAFITVRVQLLYPVRVLSNTPCSDREQIYWQWCHFVWGLQGLNHSNLADIFAP